MVLNKKGQVIFISLMLGIVMFLLGLALAHPLNQVVSTSMTQMNCTNSTATYQEKANCVAVDTFNPLLVGTLFGIAGIILGRAFS